MGSTEPIKKCLLLSDYSINNKYKERYNDNIKKRDGNKIGKC